MSYQRTKNFEKLSFLYLITGNLEKLRKMMKIAETRKDASSQYQSALYLGDVSERVKVLKNCGQPSLAYLTAATHGLTQIAEELRKDVSTEIRADPTATLLQPPVPIELQETNWPLLVVTKSVFDVTTDLGNLEMQEGGEECQGGGAWEEELVWEEVKNKADEVVEVHEEEQGWDVGEEELELGMEETENPTGPEEPEKEFFVAPVKGKPPMEKLVLESKIVVHHVVAGSFDSAMRLLNEQLGIVEFAALKSFMMEVLTSAKTAFEGLPIMPSLIGYSFRLVLEAFDVQICFSFFSKD
jgi:coatomer protein complex subunit alpha (xenin)